jgi:hypothetical protein
MNSQDNEISFLFSVDEADVIRAALGKMPHDEAQPIVMKMYETVRNHVFGVGDEQRIAPKRRAVKKSRLRLSLERGPKKADSPFGVKKDGTPKKRPGRAPKEQA